MFIRVNRDEYGSGFGELSGFDKGGMAFGEDDASHLLKILEGPSPYEPYLKRAMASRAGTLPKRFFRVVTSVKTQVPKYLQHLFVAHAGGLMTGGTIDRWTRTIYVAQAPGLREATRLQYAIHEGVHLFAHPQAPTQQQCPQPCIGTFQRQFGRGFGEGLTQVITEDIMAAQGISDYHSDPRKRPYHDEVEVIREVVRLFGRDVLARAYFFGDVKPLRTAMEARWGMSWHAVTATAGDKSRALSHIREAEAAYRRRQAEEAARLKRIEDLMRNAPRGDFPTPSRERSIA